MLVESNDLVTSTNAAHLAGVSLAQLNQHVQGGQLKPFVVIDGVRFFHKNEVLGLRTFIATLAGRRPTPPLPRMQELF